MIKDFVDVWSYPNKEMTASETVHRFRFRTQYDGGQLEQTSHDVEQLKDAFAMLVEFLYENHSLTKEQVERIAGLK